jgi:hypothetical protein
MEHESINEPKKPYTTPVLNTLGALEQLTKGQGWRGNDDQWWFFHWGEDGSG